MRKIIKGIVSLLVRIRWVMHSRVHISSSSIFKGFPQIEIDRGELSIGDGAIINSIQRGYHLHMYARTRIFVDGAEARILIGTNTRIHGSCIHAVTSISIGSNCLIAANCQIFDNSGHDTDVADPATRLLTRGESAPVTIEDDVWIGSGVTIFPGVIIGRGSVIGAGSVVTKNIPAGVLAAGSPAKVIRRLNLAP